MIIQISDPRTVISSQESYRNVLKGLQDSFIELQFNDLRGSVDSYISNQDPFEYEMYTTKDVGLIAGQQIILTLPRYGSLTFEVDVDTEEDIPDTLYMTQLSSSDINILGANIDNMYIVRPNHRIEYRFLDFRGIWSTGFEPLLIDEIFTTVGNARGDAKINVKLASQILRSIYSNSDEQNPNIYNIFEVEYREVYDDFTGSWTRALPSDGQTGIPFVSVLAAGNNPAQYNIGNDFIDKEVQQRYWKGYPVTFSIIRNPDFSAVSLPALVSFYALDNSKSWAVFPENENNIFKSVTFSTITTGEDYGVVNIEFNFDDSRFPANDPFLFVFGHLHSSSELRNINPTSLDIKLTAYNTTGDSDKEFYFRWHSEEGSRRHWLFTKTAQYREQGNNDITLTNFRQIPSSYTDAVRVSADGLSEIEFQYVKSMLSSNFVVRWVSMQEFPCIIEKGSFNYSNNTNTYSITLDIRFKDKALLNV